MRSTYSRFAFCFAILFFAVSLGVPSFTSPAAAQDDGWLLVRALYGFRDAQVDVTDLLRDLIVRGGFNGRIPVTNQTMGGDPAVGKDKTLHIIARNRRGEEREFNFREGSFIEAGMFLVPPPPPRDDFGDRDRGRDNDRDRDRDRDLYIIRGYYGVQGHTVNVTDILRSRVREGRLFFDVNNVNLGGDPAIGADKILIVIYRFRGEEQATAVREGTRLELP
jgi:hypothetical protein